MLNKVLIIARYTFKQLLKSKVLWITLSLGIALLVVTYVATEFTYGVPEKIALDFGLGMLSISSMGIALFMGATLLSSEIDSRTVYMVISRPVPRWVFITGKIAGLIGVLILNELILSIMTLFCTWMLGGALSQVVFLSILFTILESILLLLLVVFLSLFVNTILASSLTAIILLLGHAIKETQNILFVENRPYLKMILEFYHYVLPAFYKLNLKDFVLYNQSLDGGYLAGMTLYGFLYSAALFFLIILIFNRKNLD